MITPPLFHHLPPRRPPNRNPNHHLHMELIHHYKSLIEKPNSTKETMYTTISMGFSNPMVQACMSMAQPNGPIPPFEALAALFWVSLSKVKGLRNRLVDMSICLDMRKVLGLYCTFFAKYMVYYKVHLQENYKFSKKAINDIAAKIYTKGIMDLIEWLENNDVNSPTMMNDHDLVYDSLKSVVRYLCVCVTKLH